MLLTVAVSVLHAAPAFAHTEIEPKQIGVGLAARLTLVVENERTGLGTTGVRVVFPDAQPLTILEIPPADGWTASIDDANADKTTGTGITWTRPTAPAGQDPTLSFTVGPLPTTVGQVQFKVLQTYSDGAIVRWIDAWPAGAREPEHPGPVLQLTAGGPGTSLAPATTTTMTTAPTTTIASPTTTGATAAPHPESASARADGGLPWVLGIAVGVLAIGGGALGAVFVVCRRPSD